MERLTKASRACAIAAAAAHDLNDELTVILSSVTDTIESLDAGHPARPLLLELRGAAQRCAWMAASLLTYGARSGVRPTPTPLSDLVV